MSQDLLGVTREPVEPERPVPAPAPPPMPLVAHAHGKATRGQRIALLAGLIVVAWLALQLFASVLLPFVAAAGIAYVLDPPTRRLTRLGMPRQWSATVMILGMIAATLLFALLLYPLIVVQLGLLIGRVPQYVALLQHWAGEVMSNLQDSFGRDVVNDKVRDLVSGQAGAMLSYIAPALSSLIGGGFAIFNVLTLLIVTGRASPARSTAGCPTATGR
jgi:predicted PurR-regulated permease PerM